MSNTRLHITLLLLLTLTINSQYCAAKEILVANIDEFNVAIKGVSPGDHIILKNGEWKNVNLIVHGQGTLELPITIEAEASGNVIISGDSSLKMTGTYLIVKGLWFKDGYTSGNAVISFRNNSSEFATNSRVTECAITNYNPTSKDQEYKWIDVWGKNNRIDHNYFIGKNNSGSLLVVWLKGDQHIENNHSIDHNHFAGRPPLGKNGGETIRIGTSKTSMSSSKTLVENNLFEKCNGEIEIISNKSGDNIFRDNLFLENEGTLTLRHGDNALVEGNVFIGNQKSKTGGVRVINANHIIRNNMMIGLTGSGFRGPIVVMNGVPNSPLNRYNQVQNVDIQYNTVIDCSPVQFAAGKDDERTLPPINTTFANNIISNSGDSDKVIEVSDDIKGFNFSSNIIDANATFAAKGFTQYKVEWNLFNNAVLIPTLDNGTKLKATKINDYNPTVDITGAKRNSYTIGAYNIENKALPKALVIKTGPTTWKPKVEPLIEITNTIIEVEPGIGTLNKAMSKAVKGSTLKLKSGMFILEKGIKIKTDVSIIGNDADKKSVIKIQDNLEKTSNYIFRLDSKAILKLKNLELTGENKTPIKYAVASSNTSENSPFSVFIDNCLIHNFNNRTGGGSVYKSYKGTFADTISIKNSRIENSYRGLNLSENKKGSGQSSAKVVILENSIFSEIEQWALNYFRDETLSNEDQDAQLYINNCIFSRVADYEKGRILKTTGISFVKIENSVFEKSYKIQNPLSLSGQKNFINNCLLFNAGQIKLSNNAKSDNIIYKNPKWEDFKNFIPSSKSPLVKNDQNKQIGLSFKNKK
ncbi:hypothetical protein GCM10022393_27350 [Aquimarina addita]|uniref:Poly(Beta-D-mannuronate) lyase n=1 Tax=Aquimarina addita TaxID=870485 RepID=A0ABP6UN85_9FLAO